MKNASKLFVTAKHLLFIICFVKNKISELLILNYYTADRVVSGGSYAKLLFTICSPFKKIYIPETRKICTYIYMQGFAVLCTCYW